MPKVRISAPVDWRRPLSFLATWCGLSWKVGRVALSLLWWGRLAKVVRVALSLSPMRWAGEGWRGGYSVSSAGRRAWFPPWRRKRQLLFPCCVDDFVATSFGVAIVSFNAPASYDRALFQCSLKAQSFMKEHCLAFDMTHLYPSLNKSLFFLNLLG